MNTVLVFAVVQAFNLVVLVWFNRVALVRVLALRQQLSVYKRKAKKPRLSCFEEQPKFLLHDYRLAA